MRLNWRLCRLLARLRICEIVSSLLVTLVKLLVVGRVLVICWDVRVAVVVVDRSLD